jgi:predicted XRE-type DNA-binding protein
MTRKKPEYEMGSGNVFADLGLEDADELLIRAKLGHTVRMILEKSSLKQKEISELLKINQSEVSKLMNGKYHLFSEGRLFGFLNKLDRKVTVQISPRQKDDDPQEVVLA